MFKPFVCPVLLIPFSLLPILCPVPSTRLCQDMHISQTHFPSQTRTLTDPGQLLQQVARTAKPLQQLSSLGSCLHDNNRHDAPADEFLPCFHLRENSVILNFFVNDILNRNHLKHQFRSDLFSCNETSLATYGHKEIMKTLLCMSFPFTSLGFMTVSVFLKIFSVTVLPSLCSLFLPPLIEVALLARGIKVGTDTKRTHFIWFWRNIK